MGNHLDPPLNFSCFFHPNPCSASPSIPWKKKKKGQEFLLDPAGLSLALGNRCHPREGGKRDGSWWHSGVWHVGGASVREPIPWECGCGEEDPTESWNGLDRGDLKAHSLPMGRPRLSHPASGTSRDSRAPLGILAGSSTLGASTGSCSKTFSSEAWKEEKSREQNGVGGTTAAASQFVPLREFSGNILFTALFGFQVETRNSSLILLFPLFSRWRPKTPP